jgi:pimeloyl-ACP methyl ester carboxylesterase
MGRQALRLISAKATY